MGARGRAQRQEFGVAALGMAGRDANLHAASQVAAISRAMIEADPWTAVYLPFRKRRMYDC
jgi:hypothetical protein